jgi:hypothetical protein
MLFDQTFDFQESRDQVPFVLVTLARERFRMMYRATDFSSIDRISETFSSVEWFK